MSVSQLNAREIDLTNSEHVKRIILEIESEQNRRRKKNAWVLNQCKEGNQREYVQDTLASLYPETSSKFRLGDINICGKIDNKLSKAYKQAPLRKCEKDKESEALEAIYNDYHFDLAFKEADSIFNLHKYVFLWLTWQNPDSKLGIQVGSYVLHALKPYEYDLIRDQVTGEPIIFIQSQAESEVTRLAGKSDGVEQTITESQSDTSAESKIYYLWDAKHYVEVVVKKSKGHGNEAKETMSINYQEKKNNIIARLPGTYLQADSSVDYPVKSNLAYQSIDWNVAFSDLKTAAATQGHGQLVISHPEGQKFKKVHMGMHTSVLLPQSKKPDAPPTTANYISASPDLAGQLDVLKFDITNLLDDYGIKAKGAIEGGADKFSSGLDRLLSEADVQDQVEGNQSLYAVTLEQGNFKTLKAYESAMSQNPFSTTESLAVTFEKPKVMISDKETLENIKSRDEQGLLMSWEKHVILNPNLSEKQAREREEAIQAEKQEKLKAMSDLMGDEVEDEDIEDDNKDIEENAE